MPSIALAKEGQALGRRPEERVNPSGEIVLRVSGWLETVQQTHGTALWLGIRQITSVDGRAIAVSSPDGDTLAANQTCAIAEIASQPF